MIPAGIVVSFTDYAVPLVIFIFFPKLSSQIPSRVPHGRDWPLSLRNLSTPFSGISAWFMDDEQSRSFFEMHGGEETWDMAAREALGGGGASLESRARDVFLFRGVRSMALLVVCSVLDLPHVVAEAPPTARSSSSPALCSPDNAVQRPECVGLKQDY